MPSHQVVVIGASSAPLGPNTIWVPTVAEAVPYVGDPSVAIAMADTALMGGKTTRLELVYAHAASGGKVVVLLATDIAVALTWDTPTAVELSLPAMTSDLAALLDVDTPDTDAAVAAHITVQGRDADPVTAWKRGNIWFDPLSRALLVGGAYAREPVRLNERANCPDSDDSSPGHDWARCCSGFSGFIEQHLTQDRWPDDHLLQVEFSEGVRFGGSTRSEFFHWVGARQRLVAVELTGSCIDCGEPAEFMSGKDREGSPSVLRERCAAHVRRHTFTFAEVASMAEHIKWRPPLSPRST